LFVQVLRLCANAGLIKLGHVAIDGTKMKANASKHKAMSYKRIEPPRLSRRLHHLRGWSNGEAKKEVPHRGQGTSSADGDGVRGGPTLPVGSDSIDRLEDRLHARNPADLGSPGRT